jgi:hypothetical protein
MHIKSAVCRSNSTSVRINTTSYRSKSTGRGNLAASASRQVGAPASCIEAGPLSVDSHPPSGESVPSQLYRRVCRVGGHTREAAGPPHQESSAPPPAGSFRHRSALGACEGDRPSRLDCNSRREPGTRSLEETSRPPQDGRPVRHTGRSPLHSLGSRLRPDVDPLRDRPHDPQREQRRVGVDDRRQRRVVV